MTNELTTTDLRFVIGRIPSDIRKLLQENAGVLFVAGGFVRAVVAGEEINDVDLWAPDASALNRIAEQLKRRREAEGQRCKMHHSDNAATLITENRATVQFITRWTFADGPSLVGSFDFTIVQAAVWWGKNGWESTTGPGFYADLAARRLVYTHPVRVEEAGGSLLRVLKYVKKGYNIQPGSLGGVVARLYSAIDQEKVSARSIHLGPGHDREKITAYVITGLLREVDPSLAIDGLDVQNDDHGV